jgi:hypothetical protein
MPGQLKIVSGTVHSAEQPFVVRVEISGAQPGDRVNVRLSQTSGTQPYHADARPADITASGRGLAEFDVVLHGPGSTAVLVADADPLRSDEIHIEVIP